MTKSESCFAIFHFYSIFVIGLPVLLVIPTGCVDFEQEEQKSFKLECRQYGYGRLDTSSPLTCCQGAKLLKSFNLFNDSNMDECAAVVKSVDDDDLPTSLDRRNLCLLKARGVANDKLTSFRKYVNLMGENYDETMRNTIFRNTKCADADKETDEFKRFQKLNKCYYDGEQKVCKPSQPYSGRTLHERLSSNLEVCKGLRMVLPIVEEVYLYDVIDPSSIETLTCVDYLHTKATDPEKPHLKNCRHACTLRGDKYKSKNDLKMDLKELQSKIFIGYSKSTREELLKIWNAMTLENNFIMPDQSKGTFDDAVKWMEGLDEPTYIRAYCAVFERMFRYLLQEAVGVYCDDTKKDKYSGYKIEPRELKSVM